MTDPVRRRRRTFSTSTFQPLLGYFPTVRDGLDSIAVGTDGATQAIISISEDPGPPRDGPPGRPPITAVSAGRLAEDPVRSPPVYPRRASVMNARLLRRNRVWPPRALGSNTGPAAQGSALSLAMFASDPTHRSRGIADHECWGSTAFGSTGHTTRLGRGRCGWRRPARTGGT